MDILGFWGAVIWLNRAFFAAQPDLECESGIVDGVFEPYAFWRGTGDSLLFEDSSFSVAYDNRSFNNEVHYGRDGDVTERSVENLEGFSNSFLRLCPKNGFEECSYRYDVINNSVCERNTKGHFGKISEPFFENMLGGNIKTVSVVDFATGIEGDFLADWRDRSVVTRTEEFETNGIINVIFDGVDKELKSAAIYGCSNEPVKGICRNDEYNLHKVNCGFDVNFGSHCSDEISRLYHGCLCDKGCTRLFDRVCRYPADSLAVGGLIFCGAVSTKEIYTDENRIYSASVRNYEFLETEAIGMAPKAWENGEYKVGALTRSVSETRLCGNELRELRGIVMKENVNHLTSAEIKIEVSGGGVSKEEIDMDKLAQRLSEAIGEALANISEGVHNI